MNKPAARNLINLLSELTFFLSKNINEQNYSRELEKFAQWADIFFNQQTIKEETYSHELDKFALGADIFFQTKKA